MAKIKGSDLMVFMGSGANAKSIAFATNHSLEISTETVDTSNKDQSSDWQANEAGKLSWTLSSENLYSYDGEGNNYEDLFDAMVAKTQLTLAFTLKSQSSDDVPSGGWTPTAASSSTPLYTGTAIIASLSLNAPHGDFSSFSVQFQGCSALEKKTTA